MKCRSFDGFSHYRRNPKAKNRLKEGQNYTISLEH